MPKIVTFLDPLLFYALEFLDKPYSILGLSGGKDFVIPHVLKAARELDRASLRRNHRTTLCHPNISLGITLDAENGGEFHLTVSERTK